jgi:hypothetical protein
MPTVWPRGLSGRFAGGQVGRRAGSAIRCMSYVVSNTLFPITSTVFVNEMNVDSRLEAIRTQYARDSDSSAKLHSCRLRRDSPVPGLS